MRARCAAALAAILLTHASTWAAPQFGQVQVVQNNTGNTTTSVTLSLPFTSGGVTLAPSRSSRGDFAFENLLTTGGILITTISENGRDNSAGGDPAGTFFSTSASDVTTGNRWYVPVHNAPDGEEWNVNFHFAYFPYVDGWIGAHVTNGATNNGALNTITGSAGLTVSSTAAQTHGIFDDAATAGLYQVNLNGVNSNTDGILLVTGGRNEDNYALSNHNADGSWTVLVKDNGSNGAAYENDGFGFVYLPKTSVVSSGAGVYALASVNAALGRRVEGGDFVLVRSNVGVYSLYVPGLDAASAALLLSPDSGGTNQLDNMWSFQSNGKGWTLHNRDLPGGALQDGSGTENLLSFAVLASTSNLVTWDAGGANTNWTTAGNWSADTAPGTGVDVILGTGAGAVVDAAQTVGMLMIKSNTAFNIGGTGALNITKGIALNSAPTASTTHIISAPVVFQDHGFIIAETLGSTNTLRFDVASGNAITAVDKFITLGGDGILDLRDPVSLGAGGLVKEGTGRVDLLAANSFSGGTTIYTGPDSTTSAAFRFGAAAGYAGFGSGPIVLKNTSRITPFWFDSAGGSGDLPNNIQLNSDTDAGAVRLLTDASATITGTLSGLISGGTGTAELLIDSDTAGGRGRVQFTNINNSFTASRISIVRGGFLVGNDAVLGNAENDLFLNTAANTAGTGLIFTADTSLGAGRSLILESLTPVDTQGFDISVAGEVMSGSNTTDANDTLYKAGTGLLRFTGLVSHSGNKEVTAGTLLANGTSSATTGTTTVGAATGTATLGGTGRWNAAGGTAQTVIGQGGVLAPGDATANQGVGTLAVGGTLTLSPLGTLQLQITDRNGLGTSAAANLNADRSLNWDVILGAAINEGTHDRLLAETLTLGDAESRPAITIQLVPGSGALVAGMAFDLLDWTTLNQNVFTGTHLTLPALDAGLAWDTTHFITHGIIAVAPEPGRTLLLLAGLACCLTRRRRKIHR